MRATMLLCLSATLLGNGCIGGWADDRPRPGGTWNGPTTPLALPATRPVRRVPPGEDYGYAIGITGASPERILAAARSLLEPAYGPLRYARREIPNGRTRHRLLTPRYDVANRGRDYRWLEVSVNFNPCDGRSIVEVERLHQFRRLVMTSIHGGVWLFPPALVEPHKGPEEYALLEAILQNLHDDNAYVTSWGQSP